MKIFYPVMRYRYRLSFSYKRNSGRLKNWMKLYFFLRKKEEALKKNSKRKVQ